MLTLTQLINNPMLPVVLALMAVMVVFIITLLCMDSTPSAEVRAALDAARKHSYQHMDAEQLKALPRAELTEAAQAKVEWHKAELALATDPRMTAYHAKQALVFVLIVKAAK
jgi:hypothetical protein